MMYHESEALEISETMTRAEMRDVLGTDDESLEGLTDWEVAEMVAEQRREDRAHHAAYRH